MTDATNNTGDSDIELTSDELLLFYTPSFTSPDLPAPQQRDELWQSVIDDLCNRDDFPQLMRSVFDAESKAALNQAAEILQMVLRDCAEHRLNHYLKG